MLELIDDREVKIRIISPYLEKEINSPPTQDVNIRISIFTSP